MALIPGGEPASPYIVTMRAADLLGALALIAASGLAAGYTIGLGRAASVAERAEELAIDAGATLAQARHLCSGR